MRIVHQCSGFLFSAIGGAEVLSYHLTQGLVRRGHRLLIVAPREQSDPLGHQVLNGLDIVRLDFGPVLAQRDLSAMRVVNEQLRALLKDFRPDVLHLNDTWISSFFFRRGGPTEELPRLLTLHSTVRQTGRDSLQARMVQDADRVVAVSAAHGDAFRCWMPDASAKLAVVTNALPISSDLPLDPPEEPSLLCLGRLLIDKGFDVVLSALALLRARGSRIRLKIAGGGPEEENLKDQARRLGIGGEVEFAGWVMPDRVPALIGASSIVVVPSRWPEPFGLVALQAAQMARPAIVSKVGGLPEIVAHGQTGLVVVADDPTALADAIQRLIDNPTAARRLGLQARERALTMFGFEDMLDRYESLLREVVSMSSATQRRRNENA